jgi:hypothetical protein
MASDFLLRSHPLGGQNVLDQVFLARFPARWNHLAEKESRQINMLEQILIGEVMQLRRDLL